MTNNRQEFPACFSKHKLRVAEVKHYYMVVDPGNGKESTLELSDALEKAIERCLA
jgi:hypothetical protein